MQNRAYVRDERDRTEMQPSEDYKKDVSPRIARCFELELAHAVQFEPTFRETDNPATAFCTKYVAVCANKIRAPMYSCSVRSLRLVVTCS